MSTHQQPDGLGNDYIVLPHGAIIVDIEERQKLTMETVPALGSFFIYHPVTIRSSHEIPIKKKSEPERSRIEGLQMTHEKIYYTDLLLIMTEHGLQEDSMAYGALLVELEKYSKNARKKKVKKFWGVLASLLIDVNFVFALLINGSSLFNTPALIFLLLAGLVGILQCVYGIIQKLGEAESWDKRPYLSREDICSIFLGVNKSLEDINKKAVSIYDRSPELREQMREIRDACGLQVQIVTSVMKYIRNEFNRLSLLYRMSEEVADLRKDMDTLVEAHRETEVGQLYTGVALNTDDESDQILARMEAEDAVSLLRTTR